MNLLRSEIKRSGTYFPFVAAAKTIKTLAQSRKVWLAQFLKNTDSEHILPDSAKALQTFNEWIPKIEKDPVLAASFAIYRGAFLDVFKKG